MISLQNFRRQKLGLYFWINKIGYIDLFFFFVFFFTKIGQNVPALIINGPKCFLFNNSNTSFLRPSHVKKIGQIILYPCNTIYIFSLTKKQLLIQKASSSILVLHLLIDMMQLILLYVLIQFQGTEFRKQCQFWVWRLATIYQ